MNTTQSKKDQQVADAALKKAVGQQTAEEAAKQSSENPETRKEIVDKVLFQISDKLAADIKTVLENVTKYSTQRKELEHEKRELKQALVRHPKLRKKSRVLTKVHVISPTERREKRERLAKINTELIVITDLESEAKAEYARLTGRSIIVEKRKQLVLKSHSKSFTRRHSNLFKAILLKAINTFVEVYPNGEVSSMRELALGKSKRSKKLFKVRFADVLDQIDSDAFILCTGILSPKLFEAARKTLLDWNPKSKAPIAELSWPKVEKDN